MAEFLAQVFKSFIGTKWTNVYRYVAADLDEATALAVDNIVPNERAMHHSDVLFDSLRVSTSVEGDSIYSVTPLNVGGTRDAVGTNYLPLWNTARVDVAVDGGGRPSRKFYRCPLGEGDTEGGVLSGALITIIQNAAEAMRDAMAGSSNWLIDPDGQLWGNITVSPKIQMRQLHRKRKRTPAP